MEKCEDSEKEQRISCDLQECPKRFGSWTDLDACTAEGTDPTCGPGKRNQTRICNDGTTDVCIQSDTTQIVACALPDCPKILGRWRDAAPCDTDTQEKSCGPGSLFQTRDCEDGTTDRCTKWEKKQYVRCNLADCPKKLGNWTTSGNCESIGKYAGCGEGKVGQTRTCVDGTSDKCSTAETERKVSCTLPSCYVGVGDWNDVGTCNAIGNIKTCGPGTQKQTRACTDGHVYKCTPEITERLISCSLPDCPKQLGTWTNDRGCIASGADKSCGPGSQGQTRNCVDGTTDKCKASDVRRTLSCNLPDCPKKLGDWTTIGNCESIGTYDGCGKGKFSQTRTCVDGTSDKCSTADTEQKIDCTLPSCYTEGIGDWTDLGMCNAIGSKKGCGPGTQKQTRTCTDGVVYKCTPAITARSISCRLPDCLKELGTWINDRGCIASGADKSCGRGSQRQTRNCVDGTTDKCTASDVRQTLSCNLPDCPRQLGDWTTSGNCESIGSYDGCGEGKVSQTRTCVDGTSDKCSTVETERKVGCTLPSCYTRVGDWKDAGTCNAVGNKKGCGPGTQRQTRPCTDGVAYKCTPALTLRSISCNLPDCPKQLGHWTNDGGCIASGADKSCGPGNQKQTRNCVDGTSDKCTARDMSQTIRCSKPDCPKKLGIWVNAGSCIAVGSDKSCGPGSQRQTRTCHDGTNDKCRPQDREQSTSCNLRDCPKRLGGWSNVGSCVATGTDKSCGPGNQQQTRSCVDGTRDRCSHSDRYRYVACNKPDCPKKFGPWGNNGQCRPNGNHGKQCGDGKQNQIRTCTDGTTQKCQSSERHRIIECKMRACTG